jgi:exopolysaccharide biosynthesis predicted pyruvyltransferase EpsI
MTTLAASAPMTHGALIDDLARRAAAVLDPLVPRGRRVALVDFPQTPNVGDSLIWLGELEWLRRRGDGGPVYTCSNVSYDPHEMARRLGDGTILLSGGGNLGDLYRIHQELRERVITDFPRHRIVQLPQSIHFGRDDERRRTAAVFDRHPDLTLLLRDHASLETARATFRAPTHLCPDMCVFLGALERPQPPRVGVVWLAREDKEKAVAEHARTPAGVRRVDWIEDDARTLIKVNRFLTRHLRQRPSLRPWLAPTLERTYEHMARLRLARGCRLLGAGHVVVSDRLHGHLLSLLLGIPHFIVDNSYGKVRGFHDAWTRECGLARYCADEQEALELARALAREMARD